MHQGLKLALIGSSLLFTAPAFAQDAPAGDATGTGDATAPAPDPNAGTTTPTVEQAAPAPAGAWSGQIIDRPLTLNKGKIAAYADFDVISVSLGGMTSTAEGLSVGAGYGISDKLTVGASYAFALHDFEIKGPLTLYGAFDVMHNDKLTVGASADLVLDFNAESVDSMGNVSSATTETLQAGLGIRYKVAPKLAVFTGGTSFASGGAFAFGSPFGPLAGSPLGQHLGIGFQSGAPVTFDIPVGVGLQATPQIYAGVSTDIAMIGISNADTAVIFSDFIPLNVGAFYNANKNLDVGASLNLPDLKNAQFDLMFFGLSARYYN
jgi:hypothetical protein